jgi:hypothetical protein
MLDDCDTLALHIIAPPGSTRLGEHDAVTLGNMPDAFIWKCGFTMGYCCVLVRKSAMLLCTALEPKITSSQFAPPESVHSDVAVIDVEEIMKKYRMTTPIAERSIAQL